MITAVIKTTITADSAKRRLSGLAVPWNVQATVSDGTRVTFLPGSVDLTGMPVLLHHDDTKPIGRVQEASNAEDGHRVVASISKVHDGDEALTLAADAVLTGFSVGVDPTEFTEDEDGALVVAESTPKHLALVVSPAFAEARVHEVAAAKKGPAVTTTEPKEAVPVAASAPTTNPPADGPDPITEAPASVQAAPRRVGASVMASAPSPGEFLFAAIRRQQDPARWTAVQARVAAAAPHTLFPDVDGGSYSPLIGAVVDSFAPAERPVSTAFGVRQAPSGVKSFIRPVINAHIDPAVTAAEKSDITDGPMVVDPVTITMTFLKRAANLSAEATVFTSIDVLNLAVNDLVRAYLHGFETKTVADITALATGTPIAIAAGGADAIDDLAGAAAAIYAETYSHPDTFVMSPGLWAKFVGYKGTDGRPLFPTLGPANAPGQNTPGISDFGISILGLRPVVSWSLAAGSGFIASSRFVEVYESSRIDMRVDEPTILGVALGIGGAQGTWLANGKAVVPVTAA